MDGTPPRSFFYSVTVFGNDFPYEWKAFDLLNKMRYVLWVVALLEACDVNNSGRHLGFYQELEIMLKPREMWSFVFYTINST